MYGTQLASEQKHFTIGAKELILSLTLLGPMRDYGMQTTITKAERGDDG